MTIELHGYNTGNCLRVAVALEESGLPYVVHHVSLPAGENYRPEHLALNPSGKVPVIVDRTDGDVFMLTQSNAIIMYVDQQAPGVLFPVEPRGRAVALERFFYFVTDVIGPGMAAFRLRQDESAHMTLLESALHGWAETGRFLQQSRYMAGDAFTAADIAAGVFILAYRRRVDWDKLPEHKRWFDDVMSRPAFQRGLAAFDR
jgi:GST-like protein